MELAKRQLDVGTMVHDWDAAEAFWSERVGLPYTKFEKIGGGVRQHRFDGHGSVIKVNHSRNPMEPQPTIHRRLRIVCGRVTEPELVFDPEGVEVELVPAGHDGIIDVEIVNATADLNEARRFWVDGVGGTEIEPGRFRVGDSIVRCVEEPHLEKPTRRTAPGFRYLTVQVQHVDQAWERLVAMGFAADMEPTSLGTTARVSFVRDPDGGYLEVSERAEFTGRPIPGGGVRPLRMTMIGLGNLMEVIWPIIGRTMGGDDVAERVIGVTADAADLERKRSVFGFEVVLDDNLDALRRNRPDIILFAPPPKVAAGLIDSVLRPYYDECRRAARPLPDLYAFPPLPAGAAYLAGVGNDVLVANIIPNNVTAIAGRPVVDEGHYVCTFPAPWPPDRVAVLQTLFDGQGAYVQLEPEQLLEFLGGACAISCLWNVVPMVADLLGETGELVPHGEIGEYLRGQVRALTGFVPSDSTPVRRELVPAHAEFLSALATAWHRGVSSYFAGTTLASEAADIFVERGFDLTLHTTQAEPREVLDEHAVGAATKGGLLERAIRSVHEDLLPIIAAGVAGPVTNEWIETLAAEVAATAETVRLHGASLAG